MIAQVRIRNFKSIKDSKNVKLNQFTCFIGFNGSGKSSIIEGLQTFKDIATLSLDKAMEKWKGFENLEYKGVKRKVINQFRRISQDELKVYNYPITIEVNSRSSTLFKGESHNYKASTSFCKTYDTEEILFLEEKFHSNFSHPLAPNFRDSTGQLYQEKRHEDEIVAYTDETLDVGKSNNSGLVWKIPMDLSLHNVYTQNHDIRLWQFLNLNPNVMGEPYPQKRTPGSLQLNPDGSNVAEYLYSIKDIDSQAYEDIVETITSFVLPYATDLQSEVTSAIDRKSFLNLSEGEFKVPGWMLSTGTLRIVALLAVLRHPMPAPVVVIEEIENGLDPRVLHLIVQEIREFIQNTGSQVIITTHSPYLLDLLKLEEIVFVEKNNGEVSFNKPSSNEEVVKWSQNFSIGQLYTMSRLNPKKK